MLNPDRLVLTEFIEGKRKKMSVAVTAILIKYESAGFIPAMIEEDHSRRSAVWPGDDFSLDHSWMLAFPIGDNHSELAVFFDDVDALNINLLKLLFPVFLESEGRKQKPCGYERGHCRVYL